MHLLGGCMTGLDAVQPLGSGHPVLARQPSHPHHPRLSRHVNLDGMRSTRRFLPLGPLPLGRCTCCP